MSDGSDMGVGGGGCFTGETPVACGDGQLRAIEALNVGDLVLARDEHTGEIAPREVTRRWVHEEKQTLRVVLDDGDVLRTTSAHRFFVEERGFVGAGEMRVGDRLLLASGQHANVASLEPEIDLSTVYNLSVAAFHTYFVGQSGVWVHNVKNAGDGTEPDTGMGSGDVAAISAKLQNPTK